MLLITKCVFRCTEIFVVVHFGTRCRLKAQATKDGKSQFASGEYKLVLNRQCTTYTYILRIWYLLLTGARLMTDLSCTLC